MSQPGRTNFVRVSSLPSYYSNGFELFNTFSSVGQIHVRLTFTHHSTIEPFTILTQDITAVDPTTVIVSYAMR